MRDIGGSLRRSRTRDCSFYCSGLGVGQPSCRKYYRKDYLFLTSSPRAGWSDKSVKTCYILISDDGAGRALSVPRCEGRKCGDAQNGCDNACMCWQPAMEPASKNLSPMILSPSGCLVAVQGDAASRFLFYCDLLSRFERRRFGRR